MLHVKPGVLNGITMLSVALGEMWVIILALFSLLALLIFLLYAGCHNVGNL